MRNIAIRCCLSVFCFSLALLLTACSGCNFVIGNVSTQHNNNSRNGLYAVENVLNPTSVQSGFGLLYSRAVTGGIYSQPLYMSGIKTPGGAKNLFLIATETNQVYAFDADDMSASAGPIFSRQLQPTGPSGVCAETPSGVVGITGTPVIDEQANVMYVVARNANDGQHYLHKLDITNNFVDLVSPAAIGGTDPATGVSFNGACERQRPGLLLNNGVVYAGFGTFSCDAGCPNNVPSHGWIMGYNAADLTPAAIFCTSCGKGGSEAGVWQTGGGLASDGGNLYFETGNGPPPLGDSFVKLQITASWPGLTLAGSYTPVNAATLSAGDTDLGSGGPVLIADGFLVGGGKQGRYYVVNTSNMKLAQDPAQGGGGFDGFQAFTNTYHNDSNQPSCAAPGGSAGCSALPGTTCYVNPSQYGNGEICGPNIHGTPVFWQFANTNFGYVYGMPEKDYVKAFKYDATTQHLGETAALTGADRPPDGMPGGFSSISASFSTNGILWTSWALGDAQWNYAQGRMAAFDALTLKELWHNDDAYTFAKSVPPTIAAGKVFLATASGEVLVYGLPPKSGQMKRRIAPIEKEAAIRAVYRKSGAEHGVLGTALGAPSQVEGGGWSQEFRSNLPLHGFAVVSVHPKMAATMVSCSRPLAPADYTQVDSSVYWSAGSGAHIVSGEIRQLWLKEGGARGALGFPTSDELPASDGRGRRSVFERGEIVWHGDTGGVVTRR
jgi:hypothetical protein